MKIFAVDTNTRTQKHSQNATRTTSVLSFTTLHIYSIHNTHSHNMQYSDPYFENIYIYTADTHSHTQSVVHTMYYSKDMFNIVLFGVFFSSFFFWAANENDIISFIKGWKCKQFLCVFLSVFVFGRVRLLYLYMCV